MGRRFEPPHDTTAFVAELERYFRAELRNAPQNLWLAQRTQKREQADAVSDP